MHAVAITAYTDFAQLERLIDRLDRTFFKIYIHVDTRSKEIGAEEIEKLRALQCNVSSIYPIRWGSLTHLWALTHLIKLALQDDDIDYIHLISGQDYPVADISTFRSKCDGRVFLDYIHLIEQSEAYHDYFRYDLFYYLNARSRVLGRIYRVINPLSLSLQKRLKVRRRKFGPLRYDQIHKGLVWMSLPRVAAVHVTQSSAAKNFLHAVRFSYIPEEIYFQSLLLNSGLKGLIVREKLRYQDWQRKHGSIPAIIDDNDVEKVLGSGALFARKVTSKYSASFIERIDSTIFSEEKSMA